MSKLISIVVPCFNEEEPLPIFYTEICKIREKMKQKYEADFEIILVDDGSKDKTLKIMRELAQKDTGIKYISFSRNFGKESAIYAGLKNTTGDYVAMMDADLQDPPELLLEMYEVLESGEYDCAGQSKR